MNVFPRLLKATVGVVLMFFMLEKKGSVKQISKTIFSQKIIGVQMKYKKVNQNIRDWPYRFLHWWGKIKSGGYL